MKPQKNRMTVYERNEIIQDVIDRIIEHGYDYVEKLQETNVQFNVVNHKRLTVSR
jgi:hypothetical protein